MDLIKSLGNVLGMRTNGAVVKAEPVNETKAEQYQSVIPYTNPFHKECVQDVWVIYEKTWNRLDSFRGRVKFKNGNTSGEQTFEGSDFLDVIERIKIFIQSL